MKSPKKRDFEETIVSKVRRTLKAGWAKRAEQPISEPSSTLPPTTEDLFRLSIRKGLRSKGLRSTEDTNSIPRSKVEVRETEEEEETQGLCIPVLGAIALTAIAAGLHFL